MRRSLSRPYDWLSGPVLCSDGQTGEDQACQAHSIRCRLEIGFAIVIVPSTLGNVSCSCKLPAKH